MMQEIEQESDTYTILKHIGNDKYKKIAIIRETTLLNVMNICGDNRRYCGSEVVFFRGEII